MPDDYSADTLTDGSVAVGGSASGDIESARDFDWFAVELVAGRTYVIDIEGDDTGGGTLNNVQLRRLYDADGNRIAHTRDRDSGSGDNARLTFTATETETHYIEVRAYRRTLGTYTVRVTDDTPDLGDITEQAAAQSESLSLDGTADGVTYRRFTLSGEKVVAFELLGLDADADLILEDAAGNALHSSRESGTADETLGATLAAGTYYVRVEAQESGANAFEFHYEVSEPDTAVVVTETDDYAGDTSTTGTVAVGGSVTGDIEESGDRDWFAATLEAGTAYRIEVKGDATKGFGATVATADDYGGTLENPGLVVYDSSGNPVPFASDNYSGAWINAQLPAFTPQTTGDYYIEVRGIEGTGTYTLAVSAADTAGDDYPQTATGSGTVSVGGSVSGSIETPGDQDWFAVELEADTFYRFLIEDSDVGKGTLDSSKLWGVLDQHGNVVARGSYGEVAYRPTTAGTYYVVAGSSSTKYSDMLPERFGDTGTYRLSVTEIDDRHAANTGTTGAATVGETATGELDYRGDGDWFAVTLEAGTVYRIDVKGKAADDRGGTLPDPRLTIYDNAGNKVPGATDDDDGSGSNARLSRFAPDTTGTYYIGVGGSNVGQWGVGTYTVAVSALRSEQATITDPATVTVGVPTTGEIETADEQDWFAVELEAGKTYRVMMDGSGRHSGTLDDPHLLGMYDQDGYLIKGTHNDDTVGRDSEVVYRATETATHYIAAGGNWGAGTYRLYVVEQDDDYGAGIGSAGAVAVDGSVTGELEYERDRDWFAVELEAGTTYRIKLEGSSTGQGSLRDPYLHGVYDENGNRIQSTADDDSGEGFNSELVYVARESAIHYIAVGAYAFTRDPEGTYRLSIAAGEDDHPADTSTEGTVTVGSPASGDIEVSGDRDWFAVTLEADKTYAFDLKGRRSGDGTLADPYLRGIHDEAGALISGTKDDDSGDSGNSHLEFTPAEAGTYYVAAGAADEGRGTYRLEVSEAGTERPNDDYAADTGTRGTAAMDGSVTGEIEVGGDEDWFAVTLEAGRTYQFHLRGAWSGAGTLPDPYLRGIHDYTGALIAGTENNDADFGTDSRVRFTPGSTGTYYVAAAADGDDTGTYTLWVEDYTVWL